jgi:hypothetical protein
VPVTTRNRAAVPPSVAAMPTLTLIDAHPALRGGGEDPPRGGPDPPETRPGPDEPERHFVVPEVEEVPASKVPGGDDGRW